MEQRTLLRTLSAEDFLNDVAAVGRANLSSDSKDAACALYDASVWVMNADRGADEGLYRAYRLINDVLVAESFLRTASKPRYIYYTNMRLLDRYLMSGEAKSLTERQMAARRALAIIMRDWHEFEQSRLLEYDRKVLSTEIIGYAKEVPEGETGNPVGHLRERVRTLELLRELSAVEDLPERGRRRELFKFPTTWEYFAENADRELANFLCLPRSTWHDEAMFLRMIHATECCFAGILASLESLPPLALAGAWKDATLVLKEALFFSDFLLKHWTVFETMPVANFFDGFRVDTGDASAIQSVRFQKLDVLSRGLGNHKRAALSDQPEGAVFARWAPPREAMLSGLCEAAAQGGPYSKEFVEVAQAIDADLLQWRSRHFGVAMRYMPEGAVGTGNEGVPYLKATYGLPRLINSAEPAAPRPEQEPLVDPKVRQTLMLSLEPRSAPRFAAFRFGPVRAAIIREYVESALSELSSIIEDRGGAIRNNLEQYASFFGARTYPVAGQVDRFRKTGQLSKALAPAFLLSLELRSGILMGLHRTTPGQMITFDFATEGETFLGIGGKDVRCSANEAVIKDSKGIIGSVFQGPDKRTLVDFEQREEFPELLLVVMGYPLMEPAAFEAGLEDVRVVIAALDVSNCVEWSPA